MYRFLYFCASTSVPAFSLQIVGKERDKSCRKKLNRESYGKQTQPIDDVLWNYDVRNYSMYLIRSTGKHDLSWVMQNTAVLHFCGKNKPWHEEYKNPFGMLYLHYQHLTTRKLYEKPVMLYPWPTFNPDWNWSRPFRTEITERPSNKQHQTA